MFNTNPRVNRGMTQYKVSDVMRGDKMQQSKQRTTMDMCFVAAGAAEQARSMQHSPRGVIHDISRNGCFLTEDWKFTLRSQLY